MLSNPTEAQFSVNHLWNKVSIENLSRLEYESFINNNNRITTNKQSSWFDTSQWYSKSNDRSIFSTIRNEYRTFEIVRLSTLKIKSSSSSFSFSCLEQNNWDYNRAATVFLDLKQKVYSPCSSHAHLLSSSHLESNSSNCFHSNIIHSIRINKN